MKKAPKTRARPLVPKIQRAWRRLRGINERCITLHPDGTPKGRVLLSYIIDGVMIRREEDLPHSHPHYWETRAMAETFCEEGYTVDVIHWTRRRPLPRTDYDIYIDVRRNFDRFAAMLPATCLKIAHMDTAHHRVHNGNQRQRLRELKERRGIELTSFKLVEENRADENADIICVLGNEFTIGSFAASEKPVRRIRLSNAFEYPFPEKKDFDACRHRYLWLGSEGFIHKGLDLVLEAFAQMTDYELVVCGPLDQEPAFTRAYEDLLYRQPNIRVQGWIDVASDTFTALANSCLGMVYPSCSEGGGGCVITMMHAGLIPVVSREASVDIEPDRGVVLRATRVDEIIHAVRELSARPTSELSGMSRAAWTWVRAHHSRARFREEYRTFVKSLPECIRQKNMRASL